MKGSKRQKKLLKIFDLEIVQVSNTESFRKLL